MKTFFATTMSAALLAGLTGSVIAYRSASAEPVSPPAETSVSTPASAEVTDQPVVRRWAPCVAPATLQHGVCVTEVVETVTLPQDSTAGDAAAPAPASPSPTQTDTDTDEPESDDVDGDQDGDHEGDQSQDGEHADHEDEAEDDDAEADDDGDDHAEDDHEGDHEDDDGEDD